MPGSLWCFGASGARQGDAGLSLVFARAVFVGDGAGLVGLEKQHLRDAFVRVDFRRQRRGVGKFQRDVAFPFGLKRGDIHNDAATGVGAFAEADGEDVARDTEVFDGAGEGKAVRQRWHC